MNSDFTGAMTPRFMRIERVHKETDDSFTMALSGEGPFNFQPGQFNMLYLPGVGEIPISISGDPASPLLLIHTIRQVGSVTNPMGKLTAGDWLGVRGPYGKAWPIKEAAGLDILVVAGGIGLAPLRPVILSALSNRSSYGKISLLYGARTPEDILYRKEMDMWRAEKKLEAQITVDSASRTWKGNVGLVTALIPKASFNPKAVWAFLCGPEIMMRFAAAELVKLGVDTARISVSLERNMHCGMGLCGRCQHEAKFICKDGPVFPYGAVRDLLNIREI